MVAVNREAWLTNLANEVSPLFKGFTIAPFRMTCGWPSRGAVSMKRRVVGECHSKVSSTDGTHEIFISPLIAEPLEVAGTVCHELAHVAAGINAAHGSGFIRICRHVGLTKGRPTSVMPGPVLDEQLQKLIDKLGEYPHKAMKLQLKPKKVSKVVKLECGDCGCSVVISVKWLLQVGPPTCNCGTVMGKGEE